MSIGFLLKATPKPGTKAPKPALFFEAVTDWLSDLPEFAGAELSEATEEAEHPTLTVQLHPAAEPLFIHVHPGGIVEFEASTSTGGPGYHQFAIRFAELAAAKFGLALSTDAQHTDDTGYFASRDRAALEQQMLLWLQSVMNTLLEHDDLQNIAVSMPIDTAYHYPGAGFVTQMGPRDKAWAERIAKDPLAGRDHFAWWDEGVTPQVVRNRVKAVLWTQVRWCPPESQAELDVQEWARSLLAQAYELDPAADLPWREWAELLGYAEDPVDDELAAVIAAKAAKASGPLIGYRRHEVLRRLGPCSLTIPGAFGEYLDEENDGDWVAFRGGRFIRVSVLSPTDDAGNPTPLAKLADFGRTEEGDGGTPLAPIDEPERSGRASWFTNDEPDESPFMFQGHIAKDGLIVLLTIGFESEDAVAWAQGVWRSVE